MEVFYLLLFFVYKSDCKTTKPNKVQFCSTLDCNAQLSAKVCGIREEGNGFHLRLFENECELMKYGCQVDDEKAYGITAMVYCEQTFSDKSIISKDIREKPNGSTTPKPCLEFECTHSTDSKTVCGIKRDETRDGFRVRLFQNECQLLKHNCETNSQYNVTDYHICNGLELLDNFEQKANRSMENDSEMNRFKNLVVVDGSLLNMKENINVSISEFFAATHVSKLKVKELLNETTRRMVLNVFGPMVVYEPWTNVPENKSDDREHSPTLNSCYHKCPTQCPSTYAPVCGVPGTMAREPSLMFQNHCFMDVAQCKMQWENKSPTALSSYYVESGFVFCLGYELNNMYRFLPLVRTLQHMGRLKKKGHFRYKLKNLKFMNNLLSRNPKFMGK